MHGQVRSKLLLSSLSVAKTPAAPFTCMMRTPPHAMIDPGRAMMDACFLLCPLELLNYWTVVPTSAF